MRAKKQVRPLLEALRPYAPEAVPHIMVVAEDPGVAPLLHGAGAEVRFEMYRLKGRIPQAA